MDTERFLEENNIQVSKNVEKLDMHFTLDSLNSLNQTEDLHFWHKNRKYFLEKVIKNLALPSNMLGADIGCGNGSILSFLQKRYDKGTFTGIDGYAEALVNCRNRNSEVILQLQDITALDRIENEDNRYDIVFLMDVLEHLEKPEITLQRIKGVLKKGGYIIATVPACQSLWSDRDAFLGHYKRYSNSEFKTLFSKEGYSVKKGNYFFSHLFFPTYISRLIFSKLAKKSGQEIESDELKKVPIINEILYLVGVLEIRLSLVMRLPFGTSVYCIARNE